MINIDDFLSSMVCPREFLQGMPKADLHVHLEGSLYEPTVELLARRNRVELRAGEDYLTAVDPLERQRRFLDRYRDAARVLLGAEDFYDAAMAYFRRAREENVLRAELAFDLQTHLGHGVEAEEVFDGLHAACSAARADFGIDNTLVLCLHRHLGEQDCWAVLEMALPHLGKFTAVGLASRDRQNDHGDFAPLFGRVSEIGLHRAAHASGPGQARFVTGALDILRVERVDNGAYLSQDAVLAQRLADEKVPISICPLYDSTILGGALLPATLLLEQGLKVNISSGYPAYTGEGLISNYQAAGALTYAQAYTLAKNSFESAFNTPEQKAAHLSVLDGYFRERGTLNA